MRSATARRRCSTTASRSVFLGMVVGATLSWATAVAAQDGDADNVVGVTMEVEAGVDGLFRAGRPVPIDISLDADQLLSAILEVRSVVGSQTIEYRADIEVPSGSTKRFVVAVPTPSSEPPEIAVSLWVDGALVDRVVVDLAEDSDIEFVGVLPLVAAAADLPPSAALAVDTGTAILHPVSPELLGTGFEGLWVFDSLVATAADLRALSSREADAVIAWTGAGGHLLVDETAGPVPLLPNEWQPTAGHAAAAGSGLVRLVDGQAKAGNWDHFLMPTPVDSAAAAGELDLRRFSGELPGSLANELSRDAGFDLPPITDLLALLGAYALVAGPVSFLVLRRRGRSTALWLTVPALAVITTVGVWFVGSELRGNTSAAHATVVVTSEGVDYSTSHVLVDRDVAGIRAPRGWVPTGRVGNAAFDGATATLDVEPTQSGYDATFDLGVGEFAISSARGTLESPGVTVTASSAANGHIEGEVHNRSGVELRHVTVISGPAARDLGPLAVDERRSFTLADVDRFEFQLFEWETWNRAVFEGDDLAIGLWNASVQERGGVNANPLGLVTVAAWTDALDAPVQTADGRAIAAGRTLVVSHTPVGVTGDMVSNMTVRSQLVRGPADTDLGNDLGDTLGGVYQFVTPAGFADGVVVVHVPRFAADVDIWRDGRWQTVPGDVGDERNVRLTGDALSIDGVFHLRIVFDRGQIFEFGNGDVLTVYQEAP